MSKLDRRLAVAIRYHQAGDHAAAGGICKEVLALAPGHADANHLFGVIQSQAGDQEAAVRSVRKALRTRPDNPHFHNTLGNALHKSGKNDEAVANFREALRVEPRFVEAWSNLGLALQALGRMDQALIAYRRALDIAPDYALGYNNLGNALVASGDLEQGLACFDRAIALDARYHEAFSNRGNTLKLLGQNDAALASYDRAVAIDADDVAAVNNRANLQLQQGMHREALPALEATARRHPDDVSTRIHLGVAYAGLRRFDDAILCFEWAIARDPASAAAHYYRGHVRRATGFPDAALVDYLAAIERDGGYADAFDGLLFTLLDTRQFDALDDIADGILAEARLSKAQCGGVRVIRGIAHWLRDRAEACAADIDAAVAAAIDAEPFPNDAMIGIYRQYLSLLLRFRQSHPQLYAGTATDTLHMVGESHCLAPAWTTVEMAGQLRRVVPHLVMGAKAWHFATPEWNDHKHNLRSIVTALPAQATVLFAFGEIDTRANDGIQRYALRHPAADVETVALATVQGYVKHVAELARANNLNAILQNVPAPVVDAATTSEGDLARHVYVVRFVNAALATIAQQHDLSVLDVHALSANDQGVAHGQAHLDAYHLAPAYLRRALAAVAVMTPGEVQLAD